MSMAAGERCEVKTLTPPSREADESTSEAHLAATRNVRNLPSRFGKYELLEVLGSGAYATVYLAHDTLLARRVALKVLDRQGDERAEDRERILLEARSVTTLNHPRTVSVYDINECEGRPYIAMEWMQGGSIQRAIDERGPIPWQEATQWIADACTALAAAHQAGMLHRDIKPGNLLLTADGRVKLADFGLVKWNSERGSRLTLAGGPIGTPSFMSPEQCQAEPLDECSDIYSLGATYYTLLAGRPPYQADSPLGVMFAHCSSPVPVLTQQEVDAPPECARVIQRAMAKDPQERFASAEEFLQALPAFQGASEAAVAPTLRERWRPRRSLVFSSLSMAALFVVIALWFGNLTDSFDLPSRSPESSAALATERETTQVAPSTKKLLTPLTLVGTHRGAITDLDFNEVGDRILAVAHGGTLAEWDPMHPNQPSRSFVDPVKKAPLYALGVVPDQPLVIIGGESPELVVWDIEKEAVVARVPHAHRTVRAMDVAPDGKWVVTGGDVGWHLWELLPNKSIADRGPIPGDMVLVHTVQFAPVLSVVTAASGNGYVAAHSLINPASSSLQKLTDQGLAVACGKTRCEMVFGTQQGKLVHRSTSSRLADIGFVGSVDFTPTAMDFSPKRRVLAVAGKKDGSVAFYDMNQKKVYRYHTNHASRITVLRFSRDGEFLAIGSAGGSVIHAKAPTELFSDPTPPQELAMDALANYIPTHPVHFTALRELLEASKEAQ